MTVLGRILLKKLVASNLHRRSLADNLLHVLEFLYKMRE